MYERIITENQTWFYAYIPETTDQSSEHPTKSDARPTRSLKKKMLTVFFDYPGVVHY